MTRPTIALTVLAATLLAAGGASALIYTGPTLFLQRPLDEAADVPRNTRIWLDVQTATGSFNYVDASTPRLFGPDEEVLLDLPTSIHTPRGDLLVYTPRTLLDADTTYELRTCLEDTCNLIARFRTADAADERPPAVPEIDRVYTENGQIRLDGAFTGLLVADRPDGEFAGNTRTGGVLGVAVLPDATPLDLRITDLPDSSSLRFAAYDLAGNFSGWSDAHEVEPEDMFLCAVAPSAPPALLLLAPLLVRRRRRPSP